METTTTTKYTDAKRWNDWQETLYAEHLKEFQQEQQVIDAAIAEMEEIRLQAEFEDYIDANKWDYWMLAKEKEVHDFVNSVDGHIQESQYWLEIEDGWKQTHACMPEISRKVYQLQQQINDLAALLEELTGF